MYVPILTMMLTLLLVSLNPCLEEKLQSRFASQTRKSEHPLEIGLLGQPGETGEKQTHRQKQHQNWERINN
jgi:hypothetical protein